MQEPIAEITQSKRFLIVTRAFYPANSPRAHRATELAKELSRRGHVVSVLTESDPEQSLLANEFGIELIDLGRSSLREVPLIFRGKPRLLLRALRRALRILMCYPEIEILFRVARRLSSVRRHDCIISIAAPHAIHWGVAWHARRGALPADVWIADCGDPFMGQENDSFSPAFYFRWIEKMFCRKASWISVPTIGAKDGYYTEFHRKLVVIPQGFRFEDYEDLRQSQSASDKVRFAYAGHIIPGRRDPGQLFSYLKGVKAPFEFHVFTRSTDFIKSFVESDPRIVVREFLPRKILLRELASMNFLVNIENAGNRQTPSKLIDYWLCGRPILNVRSFNIDTRTIDEFLAGDYSNGLIIEDPEQYRIENVVDSFLSLVERSELSLSDATH